MSHNLLDQNLEQSIEKPEFHIGVKRLLQLAFIYYLYALGQYCYFLLEFSANFFIVENLIRLGILLGLLYSIYKVYKYKLLWFYLFIFLLVVDVVVHFLQLYYMVETWKTIVLIKVVYNIIAVLVFWGILQIKNDKIKAWDLLK